MGRSLALVVDRDPLVRSAVRKALETRRFMTLSAESVGDAIDTLGTRPIELLVVDLEGDGTRLRGVVRHARQLRRPPLMIGIVARDHANVSDLASEPQLFDLLEKPLSESGLNFAMDRAERQVDLIDELRSARRAARSREGYEGLVGRSAALERIRAELQRLAGTELSVWLSGESGAGKTHAARTLHLASPRAASPFVVMDGETLSLAEWEAQWAVFDDAVPAATSSAAPVAGGTLFVRNLFSVSPELQQRLLSSLTRWARRESASAMDDPFPPRVLVGTTEDPAVAVEDSRLLAQLHRHLAGSRLHLPPLRDRPEDVALLARSFIGTICELNQLRSISLSPEALAALERYAWPGNVRELRNAMEHAVILATEGIVRLADLPDRIREGDQHAASAAFPSRGAGALFRDAKRAVVDAFERAYLNDLLEQHSGNVTSASQHAGMLRSALQRLLRKHGLKSARFRKTPRAAGRHKDAESTVD